MSESPGEPQVVYGEFPFELVFLINGEERIINDTLICTYDGISISEAEGKVRKWKSALKSGNEKLVLTTFDNSIVYYDIGPARYYMGDYNDSTYSPNVRCETRFENGIRTDSLVSEKELLEKYEIIIKNWTIASPIKNEFK